MKIPSIFIPDKKLEDHVEHFFNRTEFEEQGLAIAVKDSLSPEIGRIYVWEPSIKKPKLVKRRKDMITDICYHDNKLYDCGAFTKVLNTLTDKELLTQVSPVRSMCYYKNKLAYSNREGIYLDGSKIRERTGTLVIRVHNGKLYDAGGNDAIRTTLENYAIAKRNEPVRALCSHQGELYDAGYCGTIYNTITGERIAERAHVTYTLCSFRDMLLEGGTSGMVIDSFTDKVILDFGHNIVTAIETIPITLAKELIRFETS